MLSRRSVIGAALAAPFGYGAPARSASLPPSLNEAALRVGLLFGASSDVEIAAAPAAYGALFTRHCGLFAPLLGWRRIAPQPTDVEPARIDPNIAFARQNGMKLTGAHLLWHLNTPEWFADIATDAAAQAAIDRHITRLVSYYAGQVFSWNVINEEIDSRTGGPDGLRPSIFRQRLGPGYMAAAFRIARAADPNALLVYNDSDIEMDTPYQAARRDTLLRLLDRLQRDAPIDGVGLQSHLRVDKSRFDANLYGRFLQTIAARGLKILITELDVLDQRPGADFAARDADVAARYADFLAIAFAEPAVKSLVTWGLSDRYTWLTPERAMRYGRRDDLPPRPLPFDADFQPKPAYYAILDAFRKAPKRAAG
jgi:endo-1,4-beta-xylanase